MSLAEDRAIVIRVLAAYNNMSVPDYERHIDVFPTELEKSEWAARAYHEAVMQKEIARDLVEEELREIRRSGQG